MAYFGAYLLLIWEVGVVENVFTTDRFLWEIWETDCYTPPVLGGARLLPFQCQRCIKILCPKDPDFYTPLALKTAKGQHLPALVAF